MADSSSTTPPSSDDVANAGQSGRADQQPGAYGKMARKWSRFSSNLLASGLVIVAAIALLRYVAPWWKEDGPPSPKAHVAETVGQSLDTEDPHGVLSGFGDLSTSLRQASFVGDREAARLQLRQLCRRAASTLQASDRAVGPAEQRVLKHLRDSTPVAEEVGHWRMYETDGLTPIVVVIPWSDTETGENVGQDVSPGVLSWGIAVPSADSNWTLFVYPGSGSGLPEIPGLPPIDLPDGMARRMSLSGESGGGMLAFAGSADAASCRRHFDHWAESAELPQVAAWRKIGRQWLARFGDQQAGWVDVHLFEDGGQVSGGFLSVSRPSDSPSKK